MTYDYEDHRDSLDTRVPHGSGGEHRSVGFVEALPLFFMNYANFEGRSSRSAYWWYVLWSFIIGFVTVMIDTVFFGYDMGDPNAIGLTNTLSSLVMLIPGIALSIRRLHDVDKSWWWNLIGLTVIGAIPLIFWLCRSGDNQANRFGPDIEAGRA